MASASGGAVVACAGCGEVVCDLGSATFVQHKAIGCAVVVRLESLGRTIRLGPHHESETKPFKRGKLQCACSENLGNIQDNVPLEFKRANVGMLKMANIVVVVRGEGGSEERLTLAGRALCAQLPSQRSTPLTADIVRRVGTPAISTPPAARPAQASQQPAPARPPEQPRSSGGPPTGKAPATPSAQQPGGAQGARAQAPPQLRRSESSSGSLSGGQKREETPDGTGRARVVKVLTDKNGNLYGFCEPMTESPQARGAQEQARSSADKGSQQLYFFLGERAPYGVKSGGGIDSAGLLLAERDTLNVARVSRSEKKASVDSAVIRSLSDRNAAARLEGYLVGLIEALDDDGLQRDSALAALCRSAEASVCVFSLVATIPSLLPRTVRVMELLVRACTGPRGSSRTAKGALSAVLSSELTLPAAPERRGALLSVLRGEGRGGLRLRVVEVMLQAWQEEQARRRVHHFLVEFLQAHPAEALSVLTPAKMLSLLGASLPKDHHLAAFHWRDLPLHLLPSEMSSSLSSDSDLVLAGARGHLRAVKTSTPYNDFEEYMCTYVGLLREDAFAGMRQGIAELRRGRLDPRDMLVIHGACVLAMSPPSSRGGAPEGTVLELHAAALGRHAPPMFGSLLALAPGGSFDSGAPPCVWATVAGAEPSKGGLKMCVELCAGLNNERDSALVTMLLKHSGEVLVAESPAFYKAYAPALAALQSMQKEEMPFHDEIVRGDFDARAASVSYGDAATVDGSVAFSFSDENDTEVVDKTLTTMPVLLFIKALEKASTKLAANETVTLRYRTMLLRTTLDPSQIKALKLVLQRRIAVIRGPPGTGKTFIGVRAIQLLASLSDSPPASDPAGSSDTLPPPQDTAADLVLFITYKNIALDDGLVGCSKIWPAGVARVGGKAEQGSPLEHRHLSALMRTAPARTPEHEQARSQAAELRKEVEDAAARLSESRFFSMDTLLDTCSSASGSRHVCQCSSCKTVRNLLLNDPTASDQDKREASSELRSTDEAKLRGRLEGILRIWMPTKRACENECKLSSAQAVASNQAVRGQDVADSQEEEERKQERSRYSDFVKAAVRLDRELDGLAREVLELRGESMTETEELKLLSVDDVWEIPQGPSRVRFMHVLVGVVFRDAERQYDKAMDRYLQVAENLRRLDVQQMASVLRRMKVVGMTINGAAIHRDLIAALKPRYVFLEESGEVLEPLLIPALGPWVRRLVLIGDEHQLPPSVETHALARDYRFNTSLMLRLINIGAPCVSLSYQARMMPEFANLLLDVYPDYKTSERVKPEQRESPPPGMADSMWFWDVGRGGTEDEAGRSLVNEREAGAVLALVAHLVRCGVAPKRITVLAAYSGQVDLIKKKLNARDLQSVASSFSWPKSREHIDAALRVLQGVSRPGATVQECLSLCDTFLKLGQLNESERALNAAKKSLQRSVASLNQDEARQVDTYTQRLGKLVDLEARATTYQGGAAASGSVSSNDMVTMVKEVEALFKQWRIESASFTAAACHLCIQIADLLDASPNKLQDKAKGLVGAVQKGAKALLYGLESQEGVRVSSIDRYQGSENDVVITTLVRSKDNGAVGFLRERARRVVAQSRARLGMIFVGDRKCFDKVDHWRQLIHSMHSEGCVGPCIRLRCPRHKKAFSVPCDEELENVVKLGLCAEECGQLMSCGKHRCKQRCHGDSESDLHTQCAVEVDDKCAVGHPIRRKCSQDASAVLCISCERLAAAKREREETARREMEKASQDALDRQIRELRREPQEAKIEPLALHGSSGVEFLDVQDRTEKYVQAVHKQPICVTKIEKVFNPALEIRFIEAKKRLQSGSTHCNSQQLFHGTGSEGVQGIPQTGFRLPVWSDSNMFGQGVYFARDSSKSAQEMCTKGSGCIMLCDVLLGKSCQVPGLSSNHNLKSFVKTSAKGRPYLDMDLAKVNSKGFDSVFAPRDSRDKHGVQFDEMIIYDADAAIPRYIVHYSVEADAKWRTQARSLSNSVTVREIRMEDLANSGDSKELHEFNFAAGQYLRLLGPGARQVMRVDSYDSPSVLRRFDEKKSELANAGQGKDVIWVFHGTHERNLRPICTNGFTVGGTDGVPMTNGAAHGNGVYSAIGPDTPMSYSARAGSGAVILAKGLKGKHGQAQGRGYDSWSPQPDWMIFKTAEQLLPKYVVHYA